MTSAGHETITLRELSVSLPLITLDHDVTHLLVKLKLVLAAANLQPLAECNISRNTSS